MELFTFNYLHLLIFLHQIWKITSKPPTNEELLTQIIQLNFENCDIFHFLVNSNGYDHFKLNYSADQSGQGQFFYVQSIENLYSYNHSPKYRSICQLNVIQGLMSEFEMKHLIPIEKGCLPRKERDFYIYITSENYIDQILHFRDNSRIKNKIALDLNNGVIKTSCPYCGFGGNPQVIPVDSKFLSISSLFPDFVRNFNGYTMRVSSPTVVRYRYEIIKDPLRNQYRARRGLYKISLEHFMDKFNFTHVVFPSMFDGGTGLRWKNNTWVGSVGDIYRGNADLGFSIGNTLIRSTVSDYSFPFCYELLIFTYGQPSVVFSWLAIFWAFTSSLWAIIIVSTLICVLFYGYLLKHESSDDSISLFTLLSKANFQFLSTLMEQDVVDQPKDSSSRISLAFWLIFSLVIVTLYKSKLVSILAFPVSEEPPQSFAELAYSDYRVGLQFLGGAAYELFATSKHPTYSTIFQRLELVKDAVTCLNLTATTRFSCVVWGGVAEFIGRGNLSDKYGRNPIINAPEATFQICSGWAWEKRSIFWATFDSYIHSFVDMGLIRKWIELDFSSARKEKLKWEQESGIQNDRNLDDGQGMSVLGLNQLVISFYILGLSVIISSVLFIFEYFYLVDRINIMINNRIIAKLQARIQKESLNEEYDLYNFSNVKNRFI